MCIQVGGFDPIGDGPVDLCPDFLFSLKRVGMLSNLFSGGVEVAVFIEQTGNFGGRQYPAKFIVIPFGSKGDMDPHIQVRMTLKMFSKIYEPGTWNHDAARSNSSACKSFVGGIVNRLCKADIIGMHNKELGIGSIAQFFSQGLLAGSLKCKEENQGCDQHYRSGIFFHGMDLLGD